MSTEFPFTDRARPVSTHNDPGAFVVMVKDLVLPGVYHHVLQAYTWADALNVAGLIKDQKPQVDVFIEVAFKIK